MTILAIVPAVALGAIIGSFLNVVIVRVPEGESVVRPRSRCPVCRQEITPRDNIPVLSWVVLRGRCRGCATSIPPLYPIVEISTAVLWGAFAAWAVISDRLLDPFLWTALLVATMLIALSVIDLRTQRLPRALVLPLYPLVLVGVLFDQLVGSPMGGDVVGAILGTLVWGGAIGALWWLSRGRAMGFGDVTLAPILGLSLGWLSPGVAVFGLLASFVTGALAALALMAIRGARRKTRIPFGPFLALGWLIAVVAGEPLVEWYLAGMGLG